VIGEKCDVGLLRSIAKSPSIPDATDIAPLPPLGERIAVAADVAFAFCYPHVLAGWRQAGAVIMPFSPLADEAPDRSADAVYLPGGYPELHTARLSGNRRFLAGLHAAAERGALIYGECGGYMVLGNGLIDADGCRHVMAGLLPLETSFAQRRLHLGYRTMQLRADSPFGPAGVHLRGHEFHFASIVHEAGAEPFALVFDCRGTALGHVGLRRGRVMGSFLHVIDRAAESSPQNLGRRCSQ
jgi:cobyrinic acid a,c-diamide synthase